MTIKVDLLDRPGRRAGFDPVIIIMVLLVIFSIVGFYIYGNNLGKKIEDKKNEIAEIDAKIRSLEDKIPEIKRLEEINRDLQAQIDVIKQLVYDPIRYANLLDEIALIMPNNIFIQNLNIDPPNLVLNFGGISVEMGSAKPLDQISKFMQNIQKSRYFKDASLSNTSRQMFEGNPAYGFQITTHYDPDAAAKQ